LKGEVEKQRNHIDYGEGIKHKKYIDRRLIELTDEVKDVEAARQQKWEEEAEDEESLFIKEDDDLNGLDAKKRKDKLSALKRLVRSALETNSKTTEIARLKGLTFLWVFSIITISALQYIFLHILFSSYQEKLQVFKIYSDQIAEINKATTIITDFITFNTIPNLETDYTDANITQRRQALKTCVSNIVSLDGELNSQEKYRSYLKNFDELLLDITVYTVSDSIVIQKIQSEAILFITAKAYTLHQMDITDFALDNPQVKTVMYNYIDTILPAMRIKANMLSVDLTNALQGFELQFIILIAVNFLFALFTSFWGVRSLTD